MITPGTYNDLPWFAGDDFILRMNWRNALGELIDVTGYGGIFKLMSSPYEDIIILTLTEANGVAFNGVVSPNIQVYRNKADTLLEVVPLYYTFEIVDTDGIQSRLMQGTVMYKDECDT